MPTTVLEGSRKANHSLTSLRGDMAGERDGNALAGHTDDDLDARECWFESNTRQRQRRGQPIAYIGKVCAQSTNHLRKVAMTAPMQIALGAGLVLLVCLWLWEREK